MARERDWEVCFYSDVGDFRVRSMFVASERRARRFMIKTFKKNDSFYCATISNDLRSAFDVYYWNGSRLIPWDRPWVLSRQRVLDLDSAGDTRGDADGNGPKDY